VINLASFIPWRLTELLFVYRTWKNNIPYQIHFSLLHQFTWSSRVFMQLLTDSDFGHMALSDRHACIYRRKYRFRIHPRGYWNRKWYAHWIRGSSHPSYSTFHFSANPYTTGTHNAAVMIHHHNNHVTYPLHRKETGTDTWYGPYPLYSQVPEAQQFPFATHTAQIWFLSAKNNSVVIRRYASIFPFACVSPYWPPPSWYRMTAVCFIPLSPPGTTCRHLHP